MDPEFEEDVLTANYGPNITTLIFIPESSAENLQRGFWSLHRSSLEVKWLDAHVSEHMIGAF